MPQKSSLDLTVHSSANTVFHSFQISFKGKNRKPDSYTHIMFVSRLLNVSSWKHAYIILTPLNPTFI